MKKLNVQNNCTRRVRSSGGFVVPTHQELLDDKRKSLDGETIIAIQESDKLKYMMYNLRLIESIIKSRTDQVENYDKLKDNQIEKFEGITKTKEILKCDLDLDIYRFNTQLREFHRLRDKFIEYYKFTEDQLSSLLKGDFDILKWQEDYVSGMMSELSSSLAKSKNKGKKP